MPDEIVAVQLLCEIGDNSLNRGRRRSVMSFGIYVAGYIVVIIGLAYGAYLAHIPNQWIGVGIIVLVGIGILKAVTHTRQKDPN